MYSVVKFKWALIQYRLPIEAGPRELELTSMLNFYAYLPD